MPGFSHPFWGGWEPKGTVCSATARACKCCLSSPCVTRTPPGTRPVRLHAPFAQKSTPAKFDLHCMRVTWRKSYVLKNHLLSLWCVTGMV